MVHHYYETERLILKTETEESWIKILDFYEENKKHLEPFEMTRDHNFYTPTYQLKTLSIETQLTKSYTYLRLWLYRKEHPKQIIGTICFSDIFHVTAYLGYKLDHRFLKQGYCYEACKKGIEIMAFQYGVSTIKALVMPTNIDSIHLLERLQFQCLGEEKTLTEIHYRKEKMLRYELYL